MEIKIKYFNKDITKIEKISKGDWIDLRNADKTDMTSTLVASSEIAGAFEREYEYGVSIKAGHSALIHLGVGMILPDGYEAHIAPRSSTFKKYGILLTNSVGVIDNSYSGNKDEWLADVYATRDTFIPFNERFLQFRIIESQPAFNFIEVDKLNDISRGGFGSTGVK